MLRRILAAAAPAAFALACASTPPPPVPVHGDGDSLDRLAGKWAGSYGCEDTGRSGSIVFELTAGRDTASGDVLMVPNGWDRPLQPVAPETGRYPAETLPEALSISFVEASGGTVRGVLDPYRDPVTGCTLITEFIGHLEGDVITGSFASRSECSGERVTGLWRVERRR